MANPTRYYSSTAAKTTLSSSITNLSATLELAAASNLPTQYPYTLILEKDTANEEVVEVTGKTGSSYNITRNIDNSGAKGHNVGAAVEHGVSARDFTESRAHEAATSAHSVTGDIVGTGGAQTLTSKTLTAPIINAATISGAFTSTATITGGTITGATITNLPTPTNAADAATKSYIDTQTASAGASASSAAVSASSAATSASSSATSAASSLASQTAASTSAASAATSAASAATSASTMAASVTAAATSATSAATSASSALASQTAAATSANSASTSATSAAASAATATASVAAIITYANTASSSASAAATSATSAAASATAAATSATSAAASASSMTASVTAAATSATSAANSATASGNSATAAATSASSASTSASSAATSAASAAASTSAAAISASSAATSASSAATSATDAATTYDAFDDRYLGSKTGAPTVDNDGNTLLVGAIYWNSSLNNMYVWSGSAWVQIATTSVYTAPTIGSTTIASGTTYTTVSGLTLSGGLATANPTVALGLATKQYVDSVTAAINFHAPVKAASTSNISANYSNGTDGVGATLTADTLRVWTGLDGVSTGWVVGDRVLIKNQTTQTQNGVYTITNLGSAGVTAWVLTRATDQDTPTELANGDIVFVQSGTLNTGKTYVNSTSGTVTIGSTNIVWSEFAASLPPQTGNAGKYLTTDGTAPSWGDAADLIMSIMGAY